MNIFIKGVTLPVTLSSLKNDLDSGPILFIPNPTSSYYISKSESDGIVFEHFISLGLHTFHFRLCISLNDAYIILLGILENRLML